MHDPVDIDLGRYHTAMDADEGIAEWMADKQIKEEAVAQTALANHDAWECGGGAYVLRSANKVPFCAAEVLDEALEKSKEVRDAYAELMASPAAAKLRQLLAEHWAREMYETRTHGEITAEIAAEKEARND